MKYNITINQKSVIDNGLLGELDIIDLAIFDFVYHFFNSDFEDKVTFTKNGVKYTEIRPSLLEKEMPLLKIGTKRTFINRMNNLINAGLIERYENNSNENRSGYKKGVNFSIFEFDKPTKKNSQGYENNFTPPMKTDSHNNNINDNNKEEKDKSFSKKDDYLPFAAEPQQEYGDKPKKKRNTTPKDDPLFEECWKAYNRKGNKGKAKPYWDKLTEEEKCMVLPHIKAYTKVRERSYQADFMRYLRDKTFNDVVYKGNSVLYDPDIANDNEGYHPATNGTTFVWNETLNCYMYVGNINNFFDGYTNENRPNGAQFKSFGYTYTWSAVSKQWDKE